jgi:hypothetical protein
MNISIPTPAKIFTLALITGLAFGCASNPELERMVNEAKQAAEHATEVANQANNTANAAKSTADQALSEAQSAQACCQKNSEKIDRMFKKSMQK